MRWYMRAGCGALAGAVASLVLWAATPLLGIALDGTFNGCVDRRDRVTDSLSHPISPSRRHHRVVGFRLRRRWLSLGLLRADRAAGTAALGMALTILLWWRFGELMPVLCVPGFAAAAFATSRDLGAGTRAGGLANAALLLLPS